MAVVVGIARVDTSQGETGGKADRVRVRENINYRDPRSYSLRLSAKSMLAEDIRVFVTLETWLSEFQSLSFDRLSLLNWH